MSTLSWLSLMLIVSRCDSISYEHTFVANTNFGNPSRWPENNYELPCSGDTVQFDANQVISVFVQRNATISEMILPMDGEFIFDNQVVWGSSNDLSTCHNEGPGKVVKFSSQHDNWYNPLNWQSRNIDGKILDERDLLSIEKVPCEWDATVFPSSNSFTVDLDIDAEVSSINVWGEDMSSNQLSEYRKDRGKYQFPGNNVVTVKGAACSDATGCPCRKSSNLEEIYASICSNLDCQAPPCEKQISAVGECCQLCGSVLLLNHTDEYTEEKMQNFVKNLTTDAKYAKCHVTISKISPEMFDMQTNYQKQTVGSGQETKSQSKMDIQIVIRDEGNGDIANSLAKEIYNGILSGMSSLGVSSVTIESSGPGNQPKSSGGMIAGIFLGVFFFIVLVILIMLYMTKRGPFKHFKYNPFGFGFDDTDKTLENPMYRITELDPPSETGEFGDVTSQTTTKTKNDDVDTLGMPQQSAMESDFGITFGNPAYHEEDV